MKPIAWLRDHIARYYPSANRPGRRRRQRDRGHAVMIEPTQRELFG